MFENSAGSFRPGFSGAFQQVGVVVERFDIFS